MRTVMDISDQTVARRRNKAVVEPAMNTAPIYPDANTQWASQEQKIFLFCLIFRLCNAWTICTSYVPDEFWQGPEVAHNLVFGYGYLTWEWISGLRGWSFPMFFAIPYKIMQLLQMDTPEAVIFTPRLVQAVFAALGDLYLYKLAGKLFGREVSFFALGCNLLSWFTFYSITRSLTNSAETVFTTIALYYWPWVSVQSPNCTSNVTMSLAVAALTCVIRPTAAIIWTPLCSLKLLLEPCKVDFIARKLLPVGIIALLWSVLIDSFFYGKLTFVQFNFLKFNVIKDMGTFYGSHPWHWYFTQGFPVVLFTHMVPFFLGVLKAKKTQRIPVWLIVWLVSVYSFLGHKEFRFIFPVVPLAMCYCGLFLSHLDQLPPREVPATYTRTPRAKCRLRKTTICLLLLALTNIPVALYFSIVHQRGTIDVMRFLREETKTFHGKVSVLFLMPCHSTPFYSHLHQNLSMRFLQCPPSDKAQYVDEAEQFYAGPLQWLEREFQCNNSSHELLPSHLVLFNKLIPEIAEFLDQYDYKECARFFHTQVSEGRVGSDVAVFCQTGNTSNRFQHRTLPGVK